MNFTLEFDWDLDEEEQTLVSLVMAQVTEQVQVALAAAVRGGQLTNSL